MILSYLSIFNICRFQLCSLCTYFDTVSDDFQHRFHRKHSSKPHIRILEDLRVDVILIIVLPLCDDVSDKPMAMKIFICYLMRTTDFEIE